MYLLLRLKQDLCLNSVIRPFGQRGSPELGLFKKVATMKICTKCKELKELNEFHKAKNGKFQRSAKCKVCRSLMAREYGSRDDIKLRCSLRKKEYYADPVVKAKRIENRKKYDSKPTVKARKRERQKEYINRPDVKVKCRARRKLNYEISKGRLKKNPCEVCGSLKVEAHHWSYLEKHWLDVQWLCKTCHVDTHMKLKESETK